MNPDIDLLLLDFGGVVLKHPFELHHVTERLLGLEPGAIPWFGSVDPSTDPMWQRAMDGELTETDYWNQRATEIGELAGRPLTRDDYFDVLYEEPTLELMRTEAFDVVRAARDAGYAMSILTNDLLTFRGQEWADKVTFFEHADHIIDCGVVGSLKPDPRAYEAAVETTGVEASRTFFVDDLTANVVGAEAAGMQALWFDVANASASWAAVAKRLEIGP